MYCEYVNDHAQHQAIPVLTVYSSVSGFQIFEDTRFLTGTWEFKLNSDYPSLAVELECAIQRASGNLDGQWFSKTDPTHSVTLMSRGSQLSGYAFGGGVHRALLIALHPGICQFFPEYPLLELRAHSNLKDAVLHTLAVKIRMALSVRETLLVESLCCHLMSQLMERYSLNTVRHLGAKLKLTRSQLSLVLEQIAQHGFSRESDANPVSIQSLARSTNLSCHHFLSAFRSSLGVTPHQFILRKRIQYARELLATTELPMLRVANQCGFCSQSHFTSRFKAVTGITPLRYRSALRSAARATGCPGPGADD